MVRDIVGERIVRVGRGQQSLQMSNTATSRSICLPLSCGRYRRGLYLDTQENGSDLQGRRPLVLEDIEADTTQFVNVGVVNARQEAHFGGRHRVIRRQEQLKLEDAVCQIEAATMFNPMRSNLRLKSE